MSSDPERYDSECGSNVFRDASYFNNLDLLLRLRRICDLRLVTCRFESRDSSPTAMSAQRVKR